MIGKGGGGKRMALGEHSNIWLHSTENFPLTEGFHQSPPTLYQTSNSSFMLFLRVPCLPGAAFKGGGGLGCIQTGKEIDSALLLEISSVS